MPDVRIVAKGLRFPEGPVALDDGSVLLVEVERQTLTRVMPDGRVDVVAWLGGGPNGVAIGPDGHAYVCNNGGSLSWRQAGDLLLPGPCPETWRGGSIQRVDLKTGAVSVLYTESSSGPLRGPNDLVFDSSGGFWFTDFGVVQGRQMDLSSVHYARIDGSSCQEVIFPLQRANGIALAPDESRLYVAETYAARVWQWELAGPGLLQPPADHQAAHRAYSIEMGTPGVAATDRPIGPRGAVLLAGLGGLQLLDSMAVDSQGWVCVATFMNGGITAMPPDRSGTVHVEMPDPLPTNICFGGPGMRTAFITLAATGRLAAMTWPRPGHRLAFNA